MNPTRPAQASFRAAVESARRHAVPSSSATAASSIGSCAAGPLNGSIAATSARAATPPLPPPPPRRAAAGAAAPVPSTGRSRSRPRVPPASGWTRAPRPWTRTAVLPRRPRVDEGAAAAMHLRAVVAWWPGRWPWHRCPCVLIAASLPQPR
ncbi:hypothetical protein C2845_PM17G06930 [Panicum miliaceum]|uniref:Uncharacterized protein n=1 Tax=Panicum miliaceum TaxID=4540 RepID=A0A3L6Q486_PANMI|nr:hypothetical protein C2845_PM17G06930 [Panicum miliaceum]